MLQIRSSSKLQSLDNGIGSFGGKRRQKAVLIPLNVTKDVNASQNSLSLGLEGEASARQQLFSTIAPVYDQLNDRLSFGMHRVWKRMAVKWSKASLGNTVLDVCCGSGDLAFQLGEAVGREGQVTGLDFSGAMLAGAANKEVQLRQTTGAIPCMKWVQGDALNLPFANGVFDAATMGYGLRNVTDIPKALQELCRVLKPGASVAILDFNNAREKPPVDILQAWFLHNLVVPEATRRGIAEEYEYLRPSIERFPIGKELESLALSAGFKRASHYEIGFGMMGVLVSSK